MSSSTNRAEFVKWVRSAMRGRGEGDNFEPLASLLLVHRPMNTPVDQWPVKPDDNPELVATDILRAFEGHAKPLGDRQFYGVWKFYGMRRSDNPDGETTLSYFTPHSEANTDGFSEGPTEKGILAQTQRHLEGVFRVSTVSTAKAFDSLEMQLDRANIEISNLRDELKQLRVENKQLVNDQFREALILRKVAFKEAQLEKLWSIVIPMAPSLLSGGIKMLSGGKVQLGALPGAATALEQKMMGLGGSLKPEQFPALMAALDAPQQLLMADILGDLKARWQEMQKSVAEKGGGQAHPAAPPTAAGDGKGKPGTNDPGVKVTQGEPEKK